MSWLFSRALVAEYSAACCSDGEPSALLSANPTPQAFSSSDRMTAFSRPSRFGMTFGPLTDALGEGLLTWFRAASHARTSRLPAGAPESMVSDQDFGGTWRELSVKYDRDSSSWRTHRSLWDEVLPACSVTLPKWGSTVIGASWRPAMSGHRTAGSEYGSEESKHGKQDGGTDKAIAGLVVSAVRSGDDKAAILKWSIDGFGPVFESEVLLKVVSVGQFREGGCDDWFVSAPGKKEQESMLRAVFLANEFAGSSQGQGRFKQLTGELADALRELSQHVALGGQVGSWRIDTQAVLSERLMSERPTGGNGAGLLPTPLASNTKAHHMRSGGRPARSYWPTPGAAKANNDISLTCSGDGRKKPNKLGWAVAASMWQTPKANDAEKRGNFDTINPRNGLPAAVKAWPTPTASLGTKGGRITPRKSREGGTLIEAVSARETWRTPTASDHRNRGKLSDPAIQRRLAMGKQISLGMVVGGQLNPDWVEWLMNWPAAWSSLAAIDKHEFERWKGASAGWWDRDPSQPVGLDDEQIIPRVASGTVARADRLKAIGNGQVPQCAAQAWRVLCDG